jgi:P-type conjugative transfer protein TrbJ
MSRPFRKSVRPSCGALCASVVVLLLSVAPRSAHAQFGLGGVVFDPKNLAQAVALYNRVAEQLAAQRQQLAAQLTAMQKLAAPPWRDITATMTQIDALARQSQAIAYNLQNVDALFRTTFPGTAATTAYPTTEADQVVRTLATLRGAVNAAQRTAAALPDGVQHLEAVKQQFRTVQGHEQALELNGTVGVYSAEQLTMMSQQLAALTNAQAITAAQALNARAQVTANARAFWTAMGTIPASRPGFSFRVR